MEQYLFNMPQPDDPVDGVVEVRPNLWLMSAEEIPPLQFTADEVAGFLRVDAPAVAQLIACGELPTVSVGDAIRIPARALATYAFEMDGRTSR